MDIINAQPEYSERSVHEGCALSLEKMLIEHYGDDTRMDNKGVDPGSIGDPDTPVFLVYLCVNYSDLLPITPVSEKTNKIQLRRQKVLSEAAQKAMAKAQKQITKAITKAQEATAKVQKQMTTAITKAQKAITEARTTMTKETTVAINAAQTTMTEAMTEEMTEAHKALTEVQTALTEAQNTLAEVTSEGADSESSKATNTGTPHRMLTPKPRQVCQTNEY